MANTSKEFAISYLAKLLWSLLLLAKSHGLTHIMPGCESAARGRECGSPATKLRRQRVDRSRHDASDSLLDVLLGAAHQMIQRLQSGPRPTRPALAVAVSVAVVIVVLADFVEHCLPAQLSRQVVEQGADLERAADEEAQLTQASNSSADGGTGNREHDDFAGRRV